VTEQSLTPQSTQTGHFGGGVYTVNTAQKFIFVDQRTEMWK